eukprot:tig00020904_g15163.t1
MAAWHGLNVRPPFQAVCELPGRKFRASASLELLGDSRYAVLVRGGKGNEQEGWYRPEGPKDALRFGGYGWDKASNSWQFFYADEAGAVLEFEAVKLMLNSFYSEGGQPMSMDAARRRAEELAPRQAAKQAARQAAQPPPPPELPLASPSKRAAGGAELASPGKRSRAEGAAPDVPATTVGGLRHTRGRTVLLDEDDDSEPAAGPSSSGFGSARAKIEAAAGPAGAKQRGRSSKLQHLRRGDQSEEDEEEEEETGAGARAGEGEEDPPEDEDEYESDFIDDSEAVSPPPAGEEDEEDDDEADEDYQPGGKEGDEEEEEEEEEAEDSGSEAGSEGEGEKEEGEGGVEDDPEALHRELDRSREEEEARRVERAVRGGDLRGAVGITNLGAGEAFERLVRGMVRVAVDPKALQSRPEVAEWDACARTIENALDANKNVFAVTSQKFKTHKYGTTSLPEKFLQFTRLSVQQLRRRPGSVCRACMRQHSAWYRLTFREDGFELPEQEERRLRPEARWARGALAFSRPKESGVHVARYKVARACQFKVRAGHALQPTHFVYNLGLKAAALGQELRGAHPKARAQSWAAWLAARGPELDEPVQELREGYERLLALAEKLRGAADRDKDGNLYASILSGEYGGVAGRQVLQESYFRGDQLRADEGEVEEEEEGAQEWDEDEGDGSSSGGDDEGSGEGSP